MYNVTSYGNVYGRSFAVSCVKSTKSVYTKWNLVVDNDIAIASEGAMILSSKIEANYFPKLLMSRKYSAKNCVRECCP